jgi:glycerophosphoryl diester phosphodiesterase
MRRSRPLLGLLTALAVTPLAVSVSTPAHAADTSTYEIISYRGDTSTGATENSIGSLNAAHGQGADVVKVEIRPTINGKLAVMADDDLTRTTDCDGVLVSQQTKTWIQDHCHLNDGSAVPFLLDYVQQAKSLNQRLLIEFKPSPLWMNPNPAYPVDAFYSLHDTLVIQTNYVSNVTITATTPDVLDRAKEQLPGVKTLWEQDAMATTIPAPATVKGLGYDGVYQTPRSWSDADIATARSLGLSYYTLTSLRSNWNQQWDLGASGHVTPSVPESIAWRANKLRDYDVIAHRGLVSSTAVENGLKALTDAATGGADRVEFDVRPTSDGKIVVMHDQTLARTTNCAGYVAGKTLSYLQACRLTMATDNSGGTENVPSFDAYVNKAKSLNEPLLIELKATNFPNTTTSAWTSTAWASLYNTLSSKAYFGNVQFLSFDSSLLASAEQQIPGAQTILINQASTVPTPAFLSSLGIDGVNLSASTVAANPPAVASLKDAGFLVNGRETDIQADWDTFWNAGMDGHLTDSVSQAIAWRSVKKS